MSVIATFSVDAQDFKLGAALTEYPDLRVRLERVIPVGDSYLPYIWASNDTVDEIKTKLETDGDIDSFEMVDKMDDKVLVRITWTEETDGFLRALADARGTILEGIGETESWRFQVRFDDHQELTQFYRSCAEREILLDVETVHNPGVPQSLDSVSHLTDAQREALTLALQRGYFDVPRRTNVVELAEELNISDTAVSQRLRRGIAAILSTSEIDNVDPSVSK